MMAFTAIALDPLSTQSDLIKMANAANQTGVSERDAMTGMEDGVKE